MTSVSLCERRAGGSARRRVVVTGVGVVCPLGARAGPAWRALLAGASGVRALVGPRYAGLPCRVAAPALRDARVEEALSPRALRELAPAGALALLAADEALEDADWRPRGERERERTGVALGVGMVDLEDVCRANEALERGYNKVSPFFVPRILPNMAAGHVSIKYGFRGPNHSASTACATGAHSIGDALRFIRAGDADVMVCGGAESCLGPLALAGFCRLRALSTAFNERPQEASRPFDSERDGFVMGEGAAVLVLEEYEHAARRGARARAELLGYGLAGDAAHATAPRADGSGAALAMRRALADAGVSAERVSYVNAHATSTPLGDAAEVAGVRAVLGARAAMSATKGAHGHLLGAAGSLETVFTVLAVQEAALPPTLNLHAPLAADINFVPLRAQAWPRADRVALKNSFGFGGTNATLCIANVDWPS